MRRTLTVAAIVFLMAGVMIGVASTAASGVAGINATNYTLVCAKESGTATFNPPLRDTGPLSGTEKITLTGTGSDCTATPPSGGAKLTVSKGVLSGTLTSDLGHNCISLTTNGGTIPVTGDLTTKWTTSPILDSGNTVTSVKSLGIGWDGPPDPAGSSTFNTLIIPGDRRGVVSGSFSVNQAHSFEYIVSHESFNATINACVSKGGLAKMTGVSGLANLGNAPSSVNLAVVEDLSQLAHVFSGGGQEWLIAQGTFGGSVANVTDLASISDSNPTVATLTRSNFAQLEISSGSTGTTVLGASLDGVKSPPFDVRVVPELVLTQDPSAGTVGDPYDEPLLAGGAPPYTMSLVSGTLPPGLALGTAGDLVGTPTTPGNYAFDIDATDTLGLIPYTVSEEGPPFVVQVTINS